jgi:disulfide bond formation protein DsbB
MKLYCAWVLSLIGLFLSLYYSEWKQIDPCRFCWFQRVALFPLAFQLGIATYLQARQAASQYCFPLACLGLLIGVVQLSLPELGFSCGCSGSHTPLLFGHIPFPWISAGGFVLIILLLWPSRTVD